MPYAIYFLIGAVVMAIFLVYAIFAYSKRRKRYLDGIKSGHPKPFEENDQVPGFLKIFIPTYDEGSLFTMAVTFVMLLIINSNLRKNIAFFASLDYKNKTLLILGAMGLLLSLYHAFASRKKTNWEKYLMLTFAVILTAASSIVGGFYVFKNSKGLLMVFPIWNIVAAFIMLALYEAKAITIDNIVTRKITLNEVNIILATIAVVILICQKILDIHWAITFSICVTYATSIHDFVRRKIIKES